MIATGFLGYSHSPKWFIVNTFIYIFLINKKKLFSQKYLKKNYFISEKKLLFNYPRNTLITGQGKLFCLNQNKKYSTKSSAFTELPTLNEETNNQENKINYSNRLSEILSELKITPVYAYENVNLEVTKKEILKDTKNLSGIYMVLNLVTKDYYIGSASTNRFYARFSNHLIYFRGSKVVKLAVKKYGIENFAFIILELYPEIVTKENNAELIALEDKYLKFFLPNYNILTEAGSTFGYKHTEIDRKKMSYNYSAARRERIGNLNKGKNLSPSTIEKIRQSTILRLQETPMSDEIKKKCIVNTRPVVLYNLNKTIYGKYPTIIDAAKAINCSEKTIRRALQTEKKLVKRKWIVMDDTE